LLYRTILGGGARLEREQLERLLSGGDEASSAALAALHGGGSFVVWEGTAFVEPVAHIYGQRLRYTRRKGIQTIGLERAVERLEEHDQPIGTGQVETQPAVGRQYCSCSDRSPQTAVTETADELVPARR
jgi:hypothetical protein